LEHSIETRHEIGSDEALERIDKILWDKESKRGESNLGALGVVVRHAKRLATIEMMEQEGNLPEVNPKDLMRRATEMYMEERVCLDGWGNRAIPEMHALVDAVFNNEKYKAPKERFGIISQWESPLHIRDGLWTWAL
jgi:hypothetical protein